MRDPESVDLELAKPPNEAEASLLFAGLVLDLGACTLARQSGEPIPLTRGEFALLRVLAGRPGRVLSREALLNAIANRNLGPFDRSVDVQVSRLRRKIEPDPKRPAVIVTVSGSGYKFAAAVHKARPTAAPQPEASAADAAPYASPERRHITVLAAELAPAEGRSLPADPEDLRAIVDAFRRCAAEALGQYRSKIGESRGRELVAFFGYPTAHENDAERAVRAALAIQRTLSDLGPRNSGNCATELSARIGLESGAVVVDPNGEVFGDALTIATQLQATAEPGSVLVTRNVQRQVAGLFVAEELRNHRLETGPEPVSLYRIVRASGGGRRSGARTLTPFVGREEELDLLMRRWERARSGQGQFVQIVGEPGIGKSRLLEEFHARLGETSYTWVEWASSQLLQNTPLHPITEWGRLRFGADLPADQRLADLENTLQLIGLDPAEYAPLVAPLVDIPAPTGHAATLPPEGRRRQLAALVAWVLNGARSQPVALVFEDMQWADPTSLDLMRALAERGVQAPMLIIATARPEFRPPWGLRSHHSVISLAPLDRAQVRQMVGEFASRRALSKEVVEGVSERAGGVPLFVEEVTRLLLERGEMGALHAIPPTLQQSLAARLDRLGPARAIAQIGAVLGHEFDYALLAAVAAVDDRGLPPPQRSRVSLPSPHLGPGITGEEDHATPGLDPGDGGGDATSRSERGAGDPALQSALDRLVDADLLFVEGAGPQATYRFKHALIQDAAYETLLKSRRGALHRRAAEILRDDPERASAEPELVAHHFTEAGLDDLAIEWWGKAGDQALRRSAFQEAIAHLGRAITMADKAAGASTAGRAGHVADANQRLKLRSDYASAVMLSKGYAAEETRVAFARAVELADGAENAAERFSAYWAEWVRSFVRADLRLARTTAETFLQEAEESGYATEAGVARRGLGVTYLYQGDLAEARTILERTLDDYAPDRDAQARLRFGMDTGPVTTAHLALAMWHLGEIERARQLAAEAVQNAAELGHAPTSATTYLCIMFLEARREAVGATLRSAETLHALGREHGMDFFVALAGILGSWARGRLYEPQVAAQELRKSLAHYVNQGNKLRMPWFHGLLAELEAVTQGSDAALALIERGLAIADDTGEHLFDSYLHRLRGDILLCRAPGNSAPAEEAFQTAITIARQQDARSYQLLASLSLAKLYQSTGHPVEAHAVLAPALEGFLPTPEMPEIADAEALLATLDNEA